MGIVMKLELVSFVLCPFVQRAVIVLKEKAVPFEITYIDLENPPDWFAEISPFGKVPLLRADGTVLFESAIINEYLDEVYPPALHPDDPLERARHRGWIEFGSSLLFDQVKMLRAGNEQDYLEKRELLAGGLARLAREVPAEGPYFRGEHFSLLDAAYAPFFMRFELLRSYREELAEIIPARLETWATALLARGSVRDSVVDDFGERYTAFFRDKGSWMLRAN